MNEPRTQPDQAAPGVPAPGATRKRPKSVSPTTRTLHELRKLGFTAERVEQRVPIPNAKFAPTRDFINVIDLIAFRPGVGIIGIQATSDSNHAARMEKARKEPMLQIWLESGGRFEVWSWGLRGARGEPKRWTLRREELKSDGRSVPEYGHEKPPALFAPKQTHIGGYKLAAPRLDVTA